MTTGGRCYSRALCATGGKDVVREVKGVEEGRVCVLPVCVFTGEGESQNRVTRSKTKKISRSRDGPSWSPLVSVAGHRVVPDLVLGLPTAHFTAGYCGQAGWEEWDERHQVIPRPQRPPR